MAKLFAVIVLYRRLETARETLRYLNDREEISGAVLVDNSGGLLSRDQSELPPEVMVITNKVNLGYAAALNQGVRNAFAAGADSVLLLNDDIQFDERFNWESISSAAERDCLCGLPAVASESPNIISGVAVNLVSGRIRESAAVRAGETLLPGGWALLLSKNIYEKVGGFDESYFCYFEDLDFAMKARAAGMSIEMLSDAMVVHRWGGEDRSPSRFYYGLRNQLYFFKRWGNDGALATFRSCYIILLNFLAAAKRALCSEQPGLRYLIKGMADFYKNKTGPIGRGD